jgi:hypothetical protein
MIGNDMIWLMVVVAFVVVSWAAKPSPMQHCIKAGYEWIDEDCVKGGAR